MYVIVDSSWSPWEETWSGEITGRWWTAMSTSSGNETHHRSWPAPALCKQVSYLKINEWGVISHCWNICTVISFQRVESIWLQQIFYKTNAFLSFRSTLCSEVCGLPCEAPDNFVYSLQQLTLVHFQCNQWPVGQGPYAWSHNWNNFCKLYNNNNNNCYYYYFFFFTFVVAKEKHHITFN
jgi:hypothetical protein